MREKITLDWMEQWARRNPVLVIFFIAVIICSSVVSLLDGGVRIREIYRSTLGKNSLHYEKINALATETSIDYFSSLLGAPVFKNQLGKYIEYIFVNPDYYVQAVTNANGKVLLYSVTTRSDSFNPEFNLGVMQEDRKPFVVVLGKTTFGRIQGDPTQITGGFSNRRQSYREMYYFGNPGLYQNFNLALCDAGNMPDVEGCLLDVDLEYKDGEYSPKMKRFRETCFINTFSVSAPFSDIDDKIPMVCPDLDQVRLLKDKVTHIELK